MRDLLIESERNKSACISELDAANKRLEDLRQRNRDMLSKDVIYTKLANATDMVTRAKLREEIRRKVARIDFHFSKGKPVGRVQFINGAVKYIAFSKGKIFVMSVKSE